MNYLKAQCDALQEVYNDFIKDQDKTEDDKVTYLNESFNKINLISKIIAMAANGIAVEQQVEVQSPTTSSPQEESKPDHIEAVTIEDEIEESQQESEEETAYDESIKEFVPEAEQELVEVPAEELTEEQKEALAKHMEETERLLDKLKQYTDDVAERNKHKTEEELEAERIRMEEYDKFLEQASQLTIEQIFIEEFMNWKIKPTYAGCKNILELINIYDNPDKYGIDKESEFDDIMYALSKACGITKGRIYKNLRNLIDKADFSGAKYLPILNKMEKDDISIPIFLNEFVEFFTLGNDTEENETE